ncbi:MAG: DUF362 domain-containing protein [Chitinivibrionales bacterium]|nr:DUF362 domain-containing protein [Chitinivibrionales bacterium]
MSQKVFFADLRSGPRENLHHKLKRLLDKAGVDTLVRKADLVAVKLHFGEKGNTAFIRPILIRDIIEKIATLGGKPFLTDTNTLYRGERGESVSHLVLALEHGFSFATVAAPVIIADGLRGNDSVRVQIEAKHFDEVSIAASIANADMLVSAAHFKGHELTGFGGTLKNLGMGCASREGKLKQHSDISPKVTAKECIACGKCMEHCPVGAITMVNEKARINQNLCIGCAQCITACSVGAVKINWNESTELFQEKMVEYAYGVFACHGRKSVYLNFLTGISPACDCYGHADSPIVPDIGILASRDPVAIDQASADLVNAQEGFINCALKTNRKKGKDKFRGIYPAVDWELQLSYAEKLGMGTRSYKIIEI